MIKIGTNQVCAAGRDAGIRDRSRRSDADLPERWAKPTDAESVQSVALLAEAFALAHSMGWTDAKITAALNTGRRGRQLSIHTVRAWREPHRCNMAHFADVMRLVMVLPEEVGRLMAEAFATLAGMTAIDLPEVRAGAETLGGAALDVGKEAGELAGAVREAAVLRRDER